jgi:hypothetical protein
MGACWDYKSIIYNFKMAYEQNLMNIKGVGSLLNTSMTKNGASFVDIEEEMTKKSKIQKPKKDINPTDHFDRELAELSRSFNIDISSKTPVNQSKNNVSHKKYEESILSESIVETEQEDDDDDDEEDDDVDEEEDEEEDDDDYTETASRRSRRSRRSRHSRHSRRDRRDHRRYKEYYSSVPPPPAFGWNNQNNNQIKQQQLLSALGDSPQFTLEKERIADLRSAKLEKIESMRQSLEDEGVNCENIDIVTSEDSDEKIEAVYRTLNHKLDKVRYCSLAEELVLMGVGGLESIFDGKSVYFEKYRPDLTDWNITVQAKLRRVRPETAMLVGAVMRDYNISPMWRIAMELFPSAITHMRLRAKKGESSGLYHDPELSRAINEIRESDD